MKRTMGIVLALCLLTGSASAQHMVLDGETCTLEVRKTPEDEAKQIDEVSEMDIIGRIGSDVVIMLKGKLYYVDAVQMKTLFPRLDLSVYPVGDGLTELKRGDSGAEVQAFQEQLVKLGLVEAADGEYAKSTEKVIKAFQKEQGIERTGTANAITRMLLEQKENGLIDQDITLEYPAVLTTEEKFGELLDRADADLSQFTAPEWVLTYDAETGKGMLDANVVLGSFEDTETDLSKLKVDVKMTVRLTDNRDTGKLEVEPVLYVDSIGATRPYLQTCVIGSVELPADTSQSGIDGIQITEYDVFTLSADAVKELGTTIVLKGQSREITIDAAEAAAQIDAINKAIVR